MVLRILLPSFKKVLSGGTSQTAVRAAAYSQSVSKTDEVPAHSQNEADYGPYPGDKEFLSKDYGINPAPNAHFNFKVSTLDDCPFPQGDWYADYRKKNQNYLKNLIMGVSFLGATLSFIVIYEPIFFNAMPPPMPAKEDRIKSFWVEPEDDD